jgi:hypothetical protein
VPWLKIDDGFPENPKVQALSDRALRLHITAMCSCARRLTDGALSHLDVDVCRLVANRATAKHVEELEAVGLWHRTEGGWEINDYLDYNPPAERVKDERRKAAERMAAARANRKGNKA